MSLDRISPRASLLETMRALARDKAKSAGTSSAAASVAPSDAEQSETVQANTITALRQRLHRLLAEVNPDDKDALNNASEPVLREIILWEFGSDFRQSAHLHPMITSIKQALECDERFQKQFVDMVRGLKK